ncbi:MAG: phenylalanine--tRNA ligase subunit beta [Dysgonamonadaceae bacterium]|jgi:phenylalanyl-tRNA synthetase beta chain|nr:phenylalanine--tRNA ligase subunit beta [Dysgonamonadaceae bacterium]
MNISYNWLKEYIHFDLTPTQVADALTSIGLETGGIEEVETIKGGLKGLVIGRVLTCEDHPDSDHLHVTTVDTGFGEPQQIVCGAPNVAAGQKVIVATIGTVLYSGDDSFTIKKTKIRGIESNGMICAEDEIGIGTSHDGIIVLPDDVKTGMSASEYYKVESDYVLEVDITPNRIDAASHYGVARDLAAYLKQNNLPCTLIKPSIDAFRIDDNSSAVTIEVENTEACPRYTGITIKGVTIKESPDWLKNRLSAIGLRPINNVVDITNFILHETGQPLHAFDMKEIKGGKVFVKTLTDGTPFVTLDEVERKLSDKDLMICNSEEGMCIGGVFGGIKSGVTESTVDVFLESAYFNPTRIRKTARRHGLNTDSSFRFERGADPNNTLYVLKRASLLIKELAGGRITGEIQDIYPVKIENPKVQLSLSKVSNLIGKVLSEETITNILNSLEIEILSKNGDTLSLSIPTYRVDVTRDVDVIEDILRIYGYNQVEMVDELKSTLSYTTPTDNAYKLQNVISEQLTGAGLNEIMNNSLTAGAYYDECTSSFPRENCVAVKNPLSVDLDVMRQTLLFGGLESIQYNVNRKNPNLKLYEYGNTYFFRPEKQKGDDALSAIKEEAKLGIWLTGNTVENSWIRPTEQTSVYELKAYIESILLRLGLNQKKVVMKPFSDDVFSSAMSIETFSGKQLGVFGVVAKSILKRFDIRSAVYFGELKWKQLMTESKNAQVKYSNISKFPFVRRDLALLVDKNVSFAEIEKTAIQTDKKLLKEVSLFDVYEGKNLPEGKKSYAVSFMLLDEEKTLNEQQIDVIMSKIQKNLETKSGAKLR